MTRREITLEQLRSGALLNASEDLSDVEEGDVIGGYKVVSIEEKECDHPVRRWRINNTHSETMPEVEGKCTICGDVVVEGDDE